MGDLEKQENTCIEMGLSRFRLFEPMVVETTIDFENLSKAIKKKC